MSNARRRSLIARAADATLEFTVVGSFTRAGPAIRRRLDHWEDPVARPGRTVMITGATSGLGRAAAIELGRLGMTVVLVGRDQVRLDDVAARVRAAGGIALPEAADLSDLEETADLARRVQGEVECLDVLIHNAGALLATHTLGPDGHEVTVTVHLLSPHLLTTRLRPHLEAADRGKVLTMTSGGMYSEAFDLDRLEMNASSFRGSVAYARAKRAQVVWTIALQSTESPQGLAFSLVHPGWAATPCVEHSLPTFSRILGPALRSPDEGADTLVWLAASEPGVPMGGQLWLDRQPRSIFRIPRTRVDDATLAEQGVQLLAWLDAAIEHVG